MKYLLVEIPALCPTPLLGLQLKRGVDQVEAGVVGRGEVDVVTGRPLVSRPDLLVKY